MLWRGRWGATRRREYFEADSPRGPREQPHWWDPLQLHEEARPGGEGAAGAIDAAGAPAARIEARREGAVAIVSYGFGEPAARAAEPVRIVAAPFDDGEEPSPCHAFPVEGRAGSFALQLASEREWRGVRAAATAASGLCGETVAARFAWSAAAGERAG